MFRAIPGSTVFYPTDVVAVERAVELAANTKGICYIRGARTPTSVVYSADTKFKIGQAHVFRHKPGNKVTVIGGGVTIDEAIKAADMLESTKIICLFMCELSPNLYFVSIHTYTVEDPISTGPNPKI